MNAIRCLVEFSNDTHIGGTLNDSIAPQMSARSNKKSSLRHPFQPSTWPTGRRSRTSLIANVSTVEPMELKTGTEKR
jgi:hypothetical protein